MKSSSLSDQLGQCFNVHVGVLFLCHASGVSTISIYSFKSSSELFSATNILSNSQHFVNEKILSTLWMSFTMLSNFQPLFFFFKEKFKVSSNKYSGCRHGVYHFYVLCTPICFYRCDAWLGGPEAGLGWAWRGRWELTNRRGCLDHGHRNNPGVLRSIPKGCSFDNYFWPGGSR